MSDGHFNYFGPLFIRKRRNKAVHLSVQSNTAGDIAAHNLESTAVIVEPNIGEKRDKTIRYHARDSSRKVLILSVFAPTRDEVEPLLQLSNHPWNFSRVIL
jgi:hypothetical protein